MKASQEEQTSEVKLCCQMLQLSATATLQHHLQSHVLSALCCTEQCTCPATATCLCCTPKWSQLPTGCSASHGGHWGWSHLEHCQRLQVALPHKSTLLWWLTVGPTQLVLHSPLAVAMSIVEQHSNGVLFVSLDPRSFLVEHSNLTFGVAVLCAAVVVCGFCCTQPARQVAQLAPQHSSSHQSCMISIVQTISTHVVNLVKGESNNVSNFDLAFSQCVIGITANASHCIIPCVKKQHKTAHFELCAQQSHAQTHCQLPVRCEIHGHCPHHLHPKLQHSPRSAPVLREQCTVSWTLFSLVKCFRLTPQLHGFSNACANLFLLRNHANQCVDITLQHQLPCADCTQI